jgi:hypothetical protein
MFMHIALYAGKLYSVITIAKGKFHVKINSP